MPPTPTPPSTADSLPPLTLQILTTRADKAAALRLIADSVAQQRQQAAFSLVTHPLPLSTLLAVLAGIYRHTQTPDSHGVGDLGTFLMISSAAVMTYLVAVRFFTAGYLRAAEAVGWGFLSSKEGDRGGGEEEEDIVIGTRFGDDLIGALVLRLEPPASKDEEGGKGKGVIRAWTTKLRYRGKGIGGDMLREAVRVMRARSRREDATVEFAKEHANSVMVLPEMFNERFRRREEKAKRALEAAVTDVDGSEGR